jgi:hypothetical protein
MGLFSSTAQDLKTALAAKVEAEAAVAALTAKRIALLDQDGDPTGEIAKVDSQIAAQQSKIAICTARILALEAKLKREARASREETKRKWLSDVAKSFDHVVAAAEKLDRDLKLINPDYAELIAATGKTRALLDHDFVPRDKNGLILISSLNVAEIRELQDIQRLMAREFSFVAEANRMRKLLLEVLQEEPIPEQHDVEAA